MLGDADTGPGDQCNLVVSEQPLFAGAVGEAPVPGGVDGRPAVWSSLDPMDPAGPWTELRWEAAPGVLAELTCASWNTSSPAALSREVHLDVARSVVPVAADDPRLASTRND